MIAYEDENHGRRLRNDFVARLQSLLHREGPGYPIDLRIQPGAFVEELTNRSAIERFMQQTRGHFLLWGRARQRRLDGEVHHVLELDGWVRHARIQRKVQKKLAGEFQEVFPRNLLIAQENDLFSLRITAAWLEISARYVVALAALVSNDLAYSEQLLRGLETRLKEEKGLPPPLAKIKNRVPLRIGEIVRIRIHRLGLAYQLKRDPELLRQAVPLLDELERYGQTNYSALLHRAQCQFVLDRDVAGALQALERCSKVPDPTWRYSRAFLLAYEGRLSEAGAELRKAFKKDPADPSVPVQSEEFIHIVLEQEPDKAQLYFLLGAINLKAKDDKASARRDLEAFLTSTDAAAYPREKEVARKWIRKIDRDLRMATMVPEQGDDIALSGGEDVV